MLPSGWLESWAFFFMEMERRDARLRTASHLGFDQYVQDVRAADDVVPWVVRASSDGARCTGSQSIDTDLSGEALGPPHSCPRWSRCVKPAMLRHLAPNRAGLSGERERAVEESCEVGMAGTLCRKVAETDGGWRPLLPIPDSAPLPPPPPTPLLTPVSVRPTLPAAG